MKAIEKVFGNKYQEFLRKVRRRRRFVAFGVHPEEGKIKRYKLLDNADAPKVLGLLTVDGYLIFAVGSDVNDDENLPEVQGQKILEYADQQLHELVIKYLHRGALIEKGEFLWSIRNTDLIAALVSTGSDLYDIEFESGDYKFLAYGEEGAIGVIIPSWMRQLVDEYIKPQETYFIIGRKKEREYEGKKYIDYRVMGLWM